MLALVRPRRDHSIDATLGVCALTLSAVEKSRVEIRGRGCDVLSCLFGGSCPSCSLEPEDATSKCPVVCYPAYTWNVLLYVAHRCSCARHSLVLQLTYYNSFKCRGRSFTGSTRDLLLCSIFAWTRRSVRLVWSNIMTAWCSWNTLLLYVNVRVKHKIKTPTTSGEF